MTYYHPGIPVIRSYKSALWNKLMFAIEHEYEDELLDDIFDMLTEEQCESLKEKHGLRTIDDEIKAARRYKK